MLQVVSVCVVSVFQSVSFDPTQRDRASFLFGSTNDEPIEALHVLDPRIKFKL